MFKSDRWAARAIARIVFGTLLVLGAGRLVATAIVAQTSIYTAHLAHSLGEAWLFAVAGGLAAYLSTRHRARPSANRDRLFVASVVVPAIGLALMLPLAIHALMFAAMSGGSFRGVDDWLALGMMFAGLSHVVFAIMLALRARDLARGDAKPLSIGVVYFCTVLAGSLPFPILPSILVAITGLPILPLLFAMKRYIARERAAAAEADLPAAVAHVLHAA